ncbi:hypothetical protein [Saccharothrix sp. Mg75]|uniref:hypothetical protein n=1 Tax=Saccharothrix sp. Mg75 TaxID=3445357 RepID=UPI003EED4B61
MTPDTLTWPAAVLALGVLSLALVLVLFLLNSLIEVRKAKIGADRADDLRRLVHRYEQLAEGTLDAQQRAAADLADLRARTASVENTAGTAE